MITKENIVCLYSVGKKSYFSNINTKNIVDNKQFLKVVKPLFSNKDRYKETVTLIENNEIISDE